MTEYLREALVRRKTGWTHDEYLTESDQFIDTILFLEVSEMYANAKS